MPTIRHIWSFEQRTATGGASLFETHPNGQPCVEIRDAKPLCAESPHEALGRRNERSRRSAAVKCARVARQHTTVLACDDYGGAADFMSEHGGAALASHSQMTTKSAGLSWLAARIEVQLLQCCSAPLVSAYRQTTGFGEHIRARATVPGAHDVPNTANWRRASDSCFDRVLLRSSRTSPENCRRSQEVDEEMYDSPLKAWLTGSRWLLNPKKASQGAHCLSAKRSMRIERRVHPGV